MSYPRYWSEMMSKLQQFRWKNENARHDRKAVSITIEYHHKRFGAGNKKTVTLDLKAPEMDAIVYNIEQSIRLKEMELLKDIEDYEKREGNTRRERADTVGSVDVE